MNRYSKVVFFMLLVGLAMSPCRVLAANITENHAEIGKACVADGLHSTAMGFGTRAIGNYSTALGLYTTANELYSIAMGYFTTANASLATVIGEGVGAWAKLTNSTPSSFMVGYMSSDTDTEPEFFVKDGAVGFGTRTPTEQITITTPSQTDTKILFTENTAPAASLFYEGSAGSGTSNKFHLRSEISGSESNIMTWKLNGNVGIGATNPSYKLHVNGSVAGTSWTNLSSREYKENIRKVDDAGCSVMLAKLMDMDLKTYRYKEQFGGDGELKLGFIAEEMPQEVLSKDGKGVDIYELVTFTIGAMKAQGKEIRKQRAVNESLRAENEMLRKDIEKIKKILGL